MATNEAEGPGAAAQRLAGLLMQLQDGLLQLGYQMPANSPVDQAPVEAALMIAKHCREQHQVPPIADPVG